MHYHGTAMSISALLMHVKVICSYRSLYLSSLGSYQLYEVHKSTQNPHMQQELIWPQSLPELVDWCLCMRPEQVGQPWMGLSSSFRQLWDLMRLCMTSHPTVPHTAVGDESSILLRVPHPF